VLAAGAAWALAAVALPNGAPVGLVAIGVVLGSATGLAAVGIVLVWRANRVVNFAAGAIGGAAALGSLNLYLTWKWSYWVAIAVALAGGALVGGLVEVTVIRRFAQAPRLVLTVATIGLAQLLGGLELGIPKFVFGVESPVLGAFETPLTSTTIVLGPVIITGDHLLVAAVVPVVVGALAWFLRRSLAGTAIRAAAENTDRARLLGVPVRRITTLVWVLAGALAALTFVLKAPFLGATPAAIAGPAVLLPALAAAVVGRMESMPVTFAAAVTLGVVDQLVRWNTTSPELVDVVLLLVIVVALLARRGSSSRAFDADGGWRDAELIRPIAPAIAALRSVRVARAAGVAALVGAAVLVPLWIGPGTSYSLSIMAIWGLVAVSLVVLTGWGGQISLGQFALVGVGAIVAGNMVSRWNIDLFVTLAVAAVAGSLAALLLGIPALRIRGPFLAVVTLAFAVVLDGYVLNPNVFPALIPQDVDRPLLWARVDLEDERAMLWFCLAVLALGVVLARGVRRSRSGRLLLASRDNAKASEAASVSTRWVTLSGFVFSGFLAGLAGGLHVLVLHGARVGSYQPVQSVEIFSMATIGGLGSIGGAIAGAAGMRGIQDLDATIRLVAAGAGVLLVLWLVPSGLAGLAARVRDRVLVPLARRHGMDLEGHALPAPASDPTTEAGAAPTPGHDAAPHAEGEPVEGAPGADERERPLVSARGVDVSYGRLQVLFGAELEVRRGEIVALLGTNGAGKSTLLKAMCGLVPSRGSIRLGDEDLSGSSAERIVRSGVALMPGGKAVFPTLTVDEHLRLACWTFRGEHERIATDLDTVMELFPILAERRHQLAGDLSGGEQQQLALATTLMLRPEVLLIDELSLGLAPMVVGALCDVVRRLNASGITVVVVEQSVNVALTLAERAVFMEKGRVRFEGPTRELLDRPDILRSVFLEGAGTEEGDADDAEDAVASVDLTRLGAVGATPSAVPATGNGSGAPAPVLECRSVTKRFGGVNALTDVDLRVAPGEIVGLIGQNGAGKTTLMDCISGFHELDDGAVVFRGVDVTRWAPHERARGRLGRSFQEARLFPSLTVTETVEVACERTVANRSLIADATRQPASYLADATTAARAAELVSMLGLQRYAHTPTSALSTGTRRIVELACLLAEDPVLMLLDEPSAGVAQRETEALGPLLRRIRDTTGAAMLVIEHDMPLLSGLCDRLVAMELGSVLVEGTPSEVLEHPAVVASYLGTDAAAINRSGATLG
jgi:ABC-type branched-subunit amino acid transport system ATPase component/ABC-type branched-subunit amino acid transport system permease subunit